MSPLLKGLVIGFCIAAPVGPIGLLCIRRSIQHGQLAGLVSGLGAATADAVYGLVAALGLTAVMSLLLGHQAIIGLLGGIFLSYLGIRTLFTPSAGTATPADAPRQELGRAYFSTFLLTLTNPATILSFIGIFAGLGFESGAATGTWLVTGVFIGSAVWWMLLSTTASWFGRKATARQLRVINLLSGLLLLAFGVWQLSQSVT